MKFPNGPAATGHCLLKSVCGEEKWEMLGFQFDSQLVIHGILQRKFAEVVSLYLTNNNIKPLMVANYTLFTLYVTHVSFPLRYMNIVFSSIHGLETPEMLQMRKKRQSVNLMYRSARKKN